MTETVKDVIFKDTGGRTLYELSLIHIWDIRRRGMNLKHILMVGYSRAAEEFIDRVVQNPQWGYQVNGILDDSVRPGTLYKNVKVVGSTSSLEKDVYKRQRLYLPAEPQCECV